MHEEIDNKKRRIPILLLIIAAILAVIGGISAKYIAERKTEAEMIAEDFHISSDYLEVGGSTYTVSDWTEGITIELYNYEKENTALKAANDIEYEVSLSSGNYSIYSDNDLVSSKNGGIYTLEKGAGTHIIQVKDVEESVTVTVTTTAPFKKVLEGTFTLSGEKDLAYEVNRMTDNGDYYLLTLHTNTYEGKVTVTWPQDLEPDNTNELMSNWSSNSGTTVKDVNSFSTYKLIFFNPKGIEVQKNDFEVVTNE